MSLLQSVISDACSTKPGHETTPDLSQPTGSQNGQENGFQNRELGAAVLGSESITDGGLSASEKKHPGTMTERKQAQRKSFTEKKLSTSVSHQKSVIPQIRTDEMNKISEPVSELIPFESESLQTESTLPEETPAQKIDGTPVDEIALAVNAETLQINESVTEKDLIQEDDYQQAAYREFDKEHSVTTDSIETASVSERQNTTEEITNNINTVMPPQSGTKTGSTSIVSEQPADADFINSTKDDASPTLNTQPVTQLVHEDKKILSEKPFTKASEQQQAELPEHKAEEKNAVPIPAERLDSLPVNKTKPDTGHLPKKTTQPSSQLSHADENNLVSKNKVEVSGKPVQQRSAITPSSQPVNNNKNENNERIAQLVTAEAEQKKHVSKLAEQAKAVTAPANVIENVSATNASRARLNNMNSVSMERAKTAEVKIGQVDVFIEAPQRQQASMASSSRPSPSLSSRHYLRRL